MVDELHCLQDVPPTGELCLCGLWYQLVNTVGQINDGEVQRYIPCAFCPSQVFPGWMASGELGSAGTPRCGCSPLPPPQSPSMRVSIPPRLRHFTSSPPVAAKVFFFSGQVV